MKPVRVLLITGWLLAVCAAQSAAQEAPAVPAANAPSPIATKVSPTESKEIADRIRSIFSEIPQMGGIKVGVSAGVVRLSGTVPSAEDVKRAEAIASRVAGVVTIQNDLERDLTLAISLTPTIGQFEADLRSLVRALPLIGVALAIGLVIILFGYLLASVDRLWRWLMPNPFLAEIAATFMRFLAIVLGLVAMLEVLGATALIGGVLGGAGVVGIAVGFAVRDTVDNYVSSLMLSLRQPFRANDHVVIEGHEGRVIRLTSRATVLMTMDGNHLRIPNSIVFKSVILNFTRNAERRFTFDLGVDADDDPLDAMAVGVAAVNALEFVIDEPAATAVIQNVGDSNIVLRFYGWIDQDDTDFLAARSFAIQAAKSSMERAGFALPEPIYRLRFDQTAPLPLRNAVKDERPVGRTVKPQGATPAPDIDASPDTHIERLVAKERAKVNESDLLDSARPVE